MRSCRKAWSGRHPSIKIYQNYFSNIDLACLEQVHVLHLLKAVLHFPQVLPPLERGKAQEGFQCILVLSIDLQHSKVVLALLHVVKLKFTVIVLNSCATTPDTVTPTAENRYSGSEKMFSSQGVRDCYTA